MVVVLVIVAPGQGAQTPGFLLPWLAEPAFAERLALYSTAVGLDLAHYGTEADAETIRDTAVAQPLLVASALAVAAELLPSFEGVGMVAGHSVGELAAVALAGVISPTEALALVRERGLAMAEASAARPTSMTAVIGGDRDEVLGAIESAGLTPANNNGSGQIVGAGEYARNFFQRRGPRRATPLRARASDLTLRTGSGRRRGGGRDG